MAVNRRSEPTAEGVDSRLPPATPSWPWSLPPQQNARPSAATRQVCSPPATTLTRERLGGGPIAAATDSDGGTVGVGAGAEVVTGDDLRAGLAAGGGVGAFVSSSTPTGASGAVVSL